MPAEYADSKWSDTVAEEAKWKDKEAKMLEFVKVMKPIKKLSSKTKIYHFVDLFKRMFG